MLVWCPSWCFPSGKASLLCMCISVDGSSVFAAADFRLLNAANLLCSSEQFFAVRDDEIQDYLRIKAEQERLAVIQAELLSNILWCWSGASHPWGVMPVCNCTQCSKSIWVTLQALLCLGGETVLGIYTGKFFTESGFPILCLTVILALKTWPVFRRCLTKSQAHILVWIAVWRLRSHNSIFLVVF